MAIMRRYILTGTPGAGKTSVIRVLASLGHDVVEEAATDLIPLLQAAGEPEPWRRPGFIDEILAIQIERQRQMPAGAPKVQFFDRSPFCTYALAVLLGHPISPALEDEIRRIEAQRIYRNEVFFMQNLGFIEATEIRQIQLADALAFERIHADVYRAFGYDCVVIQPRHPRERAALILERIAQYRDEPGDEHADPL